MGFPHPELAPLTTLTDNLDTVRRGVYQETITMTITTTSLATSPKQLTPISSPTTEEPTSGAIARETTELGVILVVTRTTGGGGSRRVILRQNATRRPTQQQQRNRIGILEQGDC
jgi:hypothetical protein